MMSDFADAQARIVQLYAAYADAVWRKDAAAFGACFVPEAEWRISGKVMAGRGSIEAAAASIFSTMNRVLMTFRAPQIALTETGANARVYVTEQCSWQDRDPGMNIGCYHDRIERRDGQWLFTWRLFQLLYTGPADLSGTFPEQEDYGTWSAMPPLDAVPPETSRRKWGLLEN